MVRITKYLKKNGYVTCLSNYECYRESVRTKHNMTQEEIYDYEMINCDPNTMNLLDLKKRCLYDKLISSYQFEYGNQFWRQYNNNRKFLFIINKLIYFSIFLFILVEKALNS